MALSTHILDISEGRPAAFVVVSASRMEAGEWLLLATKRTDEDGRCASLLPAGEDLSPGLYRLRFETRAYYDRMGTPGLYPFVEIAFEVVPGQARYHIPLLLTANSYTTYRGS